MVFPQLWISMSSMEREEEMGDSNVGLPLSQYIVLGVQVGILGISPILGKTSNDRLTHFKALSSPLPLVAALGT